jgi:GAF domain-containing protein
MTRGGGDHWAQMQRVLEDTKRYSHELLVEHEKLRARTLALNERCVELEQKTSRLTLLCGAGHRLFQGSLERREVLLRIREVVADVVGSEEIAVFTVASDRAVLQLEQCFGISATLPEIPVGVGRIGRCVQQGEAWIAGRSAGEALPFEADLQAAIPLLVEGRAAGALAIFRLLPQKPQLESHDLDTFELLSTHAGAALHCASLRARLQNPTAP